MTRAQGWFESVIGCIEKFLAMADAYTVSGMESGLFIS